MKNISQNAGSDVSSILVGNKTDLQAQRQVTTSMGQSLAARYKMRYFETSALDGSGVADAFDGIVFEHMVRHVPTSSNVQALESSPIAPSAMENKNSLRQPQHVYNEQPRDQQQVHDQARIKSRYLSFAFFVTCVL